MRDRHPAAAGGHRALVDDRDGASAGLGAGPEEGADPDRRWWRTDPVEEVVPVSSARRVAVFGRKQLAEAFAAVGAPGLSAEVRVEVEDWHRDHGS